MSLTTWMTSFLILSTLNFWRVFAAPSSTEHDLLSGNDKRELKSWVAVGSKGPWPCSDSQLKRIKSAVDDAKALANAAVSALDDYGESSRAYQRWFGGKLPESRFPLTPSEWFRTSINRMLFVTIRQRRSWPNSRNHQNKALPKCTCGTTPAHIRHSQTSRARRPRPKKTGVWLSKGQKSVVSQQPQISWRDRR